MINFILNNFDTIFKNETSLETLDKLILDLAIRGKLVEQDPSDEPASELIKRIKAEKEQLIKEKIVKKEKPLPPIETEEIPFDIPNSWEWIRLGEIIELLSGQDIPMSECNSLGKGVPYLLEASNIEENTDEIRVERWIEVPRVIAKKGELLISCKGTVGKIIICNLEEVNLSRQLMGIKLFIGNINYLKIFFKYYVEKLRNKSKGLIPGIAREDILKILFPLPPIEEQKRIVSKVEKLQSIIKDLKEIYIKNQNNRENLKNSLLSEIESQSNDKDLLKNLEIIFINFDKIIKNKEDIKNIRNLILSLAIKGKLVEQNLSDEPASELLKRIKGEKERLIKEKVIKKEKSITPIEKDEIPFNIPSSWEWLKLGEIITLKGGKRVSNGYKLLENPTPHIYIRITDMKNYSIKDNDLRYIDEEMYQKIKQYIITKNDLYITIAGTIGYVGEVPEKFDNMNLTENAGRIIVYFVNKSFLKYLLNSEICQKQFSKMVNKMAQPKLALTRIQETIIPLPPLEEQKRIVSKIEVLMKICDLLEEKITLNEKVSDKLLESILKN